MKKYTGLVGKFLITTAERGLCIDSIGAKLPTLPQYDGGDIKPGVFGMSPISGSPQNLLSPEPQTTACSQFDSLCESECESDEEEEFFDFIDPEIGVFKSGDMMTVVP